MCKYSSTIQPRIERILMMVSYIWGVAGGASLLRKEPPCSVRVYVPLRGGGSDQYWSLFSSPYLLTLECPLCVGAIACCEEVGITQWSHNRYMRTWIELYGMAKKAI